ncbi:CpaF family protein [Planctomyces sp. SH-PL14]|uniref:CpaF family protein n=1 Tax=Planctomyces sp. SH-PL14 TaxID=1632864 RepID=UPI00078DB0A2|nr:ATPase, T2SS/T4P/T4SS family [Planctomyces sp. SH-PL14]AMV22710.1 Type IV secretion system protein PtlH [Planctomyces sp. SH-PL14]
MNRESIFSASIGFFLAPIGNYLDDPRVTEIMVNGPDEIYVEIGGRLFETEDRFASEDVLQSAVHNIAQYVGREIDPERPILDARLPDGSRVHAVLPPSARRGTYLTIRKFRRDVHTLDDFVTQGSLSPVAREFLALAVRLRKNILIAGGTGTGKTTFLNALSAAVPAEERIVVIEDSSELRLNQPHSLYLESQQADSEGRKGVTIRQLFTASLRMRPDRIIVGEVRGGEALDMVQSMISGHSGSMTTVHASTPRDALVRLETLCLMSDVELPVYVARAQVASAIHLVVQLTRFTADGSRRVTRITEQMGMDKNEAYQFRDLFVSQIRGRANDGRLLTDLLPTGEQVSFGSELVEQGLQNSAPLSQAVWLGPPSS